MKHRELKSATIEVELLKRIGKAPWCATCEKFMAPLNDGTSKCACAKCGATKDMEYYQ